jgi:cytochrome c oxidase cbb3-type subunit II
MSDFRKFVLGLTASFGLPWLCLIVWPAIQQQNLKPDAYDKEKDGIEGHYPPAGINRQGQLVYAREGCNQCHTQMIRGAQYGLDAWRKGWGEDQSARAADPVRSNTLRDYLGEEYAFLGVQRTGPDLANAGWRFEDRKALHLKFYAPRSQKDWSTMPAYRHLYVVQKIQGQKSDRALDLPKGFKPPQGYEVVPTIEAEQLVDYILSLKKAYPVPGLAAATGADKK